VLAFNGPASFRIDTRMKGGYEDRKMSNESYVQFASSEARDRVSKAVKERSFKTSKGATIKINRSKTDWQRGRDWAIWKAEDLVKEKLETHKTKAKVEYKQTKDDRKILVNGEAAFIQVRADAHGVFVGKFTDLKRP
jgi:phenylalanyl-tRNA synthetase beta subunit